jgi:hypothetical protein
MDPFSNFYFSVFKKPSNHKRVPLKGYQVNILIFIPVKVVPCLAEDMGTCLYADQ